MIDIWKIGLTGVLVMLGACANQCPQVAPTKPQTQTQKCEGKTQVDTLKVLPDSGSCQAWMNIYQQGQADANTSLVDTVGTVDTTAAVDTIPQRTIQEWLLLGYPDSAAFYLEKEDSSLSPERILEKKMRLVSLYQEANLPDHALRVLESIFHSESSILDQLSSAHKSYDMLKQGGSAEAGSPEQIFANIRWKALTENWTWEKYSSALEPLDQVQVADSLVSHMLLFGDSLKQRDFSETQARFGRVENFGKTGKIAEAKEELRLMEERLEGSAVALSYLNDLRSRMSSWETMGGGELMNREQAEAILAKAKAAFAKAIYQKSMQQAKQAAQTTDAVVRDEALLLYNESGEKFCDDLRRKASKQVVRWSRSRKNSYLKRAETSLQSCVREYPDFSKAAQVREDLANIQNLMGGSH